MKLLGDMIEEQIYNPLMALIAEQDALIAEQDAIIAEKDALIAEKDAIIFDFAIKILKEGKSHDEVAKITKLPLETIEKLRRELE
ncbi:MAG: hypothetical protein LBR11_00120 [Deltaproteobacteria bacterium]|nr:hypothetical protein [Deltaproteobacteria bacterium]